jgi:hypothetical protein
LPCHAWSWLLGSSLTLRGHWGWLVLACIYPASPGPVPSPAAGSRILQLRDCRLGAGGWQPSGAAPRPLTCRGQSQGSSDRRRAHAADQIRVDRTVILLTDEVRLASLYLTGVKHPHDMPPYRFTPSPTFAHSSLRAPPNPCRPARLSFLLQAFHRVPPLDAEACEHVGECRLRGGLKRLPDNNRLRPRPS